MRHGAGTTFSAAAASVEVRPAQAPRGIGGCHLESAGEEENMRRSCRRAVVALGVVVVMSAACRSGESAADGGLDSPDRGLDLALDTVYTIGAIEGESWETFGSIAQVAFDSAGKLYVFDRQNSRVVVVGSDGGFVREIGKSGSGPGELNMPIAIAVAQDGSIAINDLGAQGVTLFDAGGEFVETVRLIDSEHGMPGRDLMMHPTERALIAAGSGPSFRTGGRGGPGERGARGPGRGGRGGPDFPRFEQPTTVPIRKISLSDGDEVVVHEAWRAPIPSPRDEDRIQGRSGGGRLMIQMAPQVAFRPGVHLGVLMVGRYVVVDSTTYAIDVLGPDGAIETTLERPIEPVPVTDEIREKEKAWQMAQLEAGDAGGGSIPLPPGAPSGLAEQMQQLRRNQVESLLFADVIPVISDIGVEWGGRIWVERWAAEPGEPSVIDVLDAEGHYFGTIPPEGPRMPSAFGPAGLVAYIETDELDVPSVRVMRIATDAETGST